MRRTSHYQHVKKCTKVIDYQCRDSQRWLIYAVENAPSIASHTSLHHLRQNLNLALVLRTYSSLRPCTPLKEILSGNCVNILHKVIPACCTCCQFSPCNAKLLVASLYGTIILVNILYMQLKFKLTMRVIIIDKMKENT